MDVVKKDDETSVRAAAALVLGDLRDSRTVTPLIGAIESVDYYLRLSASEALGKIGAPAVDPLIEILVEGESDMQKFASMTLSRIGTPALEPLMNNLADTIRKG
ncbi:HEAT repeat domain-containing protein [candidate division WOR-3 bacterium]|nr:HEAT repeat domain-containing protein [candidate division WOR-3 bacterium]